MANELDEVTAVPREEGRDINVIDKQIPITVGGGTKFFNIIIWLLPPIIGGIICLLFTLTVLFVMWKVGLQVTDILMSDGRSKSDGV